MEAKIGVVIPSYNQGRFLATAIQSVLDNKNYADVEIAVIDGGSQDESLSIIDMYSNDITIWRSEPDGGQAAAINKGIKLLSPYNCKYYTWLNSDDKYESETALRDLVNFAEKGKYDVCYGKSHFIDENDDVLGEYPTEDFSFEKLRKKCFLSQPSVLFSKKAYDTVGMLNESLKMCLDYEYWIRLAKKFSFYYFEEYIGATRLYGNTKTSLLQNRHLTEAICILDTHYGLVPMRWILAKWLEGKKESSFFCFIPKHLLLFFLLPFRSKIIERAKREF